MKYKAYMSGYVPEKDRIKLAVRIYDSDEPSQKKVIVDGVEQTLLREESQIEVSIPYGQNTEYIKDKIKEALEKFKNEQKDIDILNTFKLSNIQVE